MSKYKVGDRVVWVHSTGVTKPGVVVALNPRSWAFTYDVKLDDSTWSNRLMPCMTSELRPEVLQ